MKTQKFRQNILPFLSIQKNRDDKKQDSQTLEERKESLNPLKKNEF